MPAEATARSRGLGADAGRPVVARTAATALRSFSVESTVIQRAVLFVHLVSNFHGKVRRKTATHLHWLLAEPPSHLRNVRHRNMVGRPHHLLVGQSQTFRQTDFDAVCKQLVLAIQFLLLQYFKQFRVVILKHEYPSEARFMKRRSA